MTLFDVGTDYICTSLKIHYGQCISFEKDLAPYEYTGYSLRTLHETQQILSDDPQTGLTVRLDLKITNDFVMEVLAPMHLRERVKKVFDAASERNK